MNDPKSWHLLYCKARNEKRAELHLNNQGVSSFFPVFSREKIVRGKRTMVTEAVFPNYLFIKMNDQVSYTSVRSTRGISDFVRVGQVPVQVSADLVYQLMARSDTDEFNQQVAEHLSALPQEGDKVSIKEGPYRGLDAIYKSPDGLERSVLLIKLIQQDVEVCIGNNEIAFNR